VPAGGRDAGVGDRGHGAGSGGVGLSAERVPQASIASGHEPQPETVGAQPGAWNRAPAGAGAASRADGPVAAARVA
jgi:hypothetical protein